MNLDAWGAAVAADSSDSIDAWNAAWVDALHFVGDPIEALAGANSGDDHFALGSVFCGAYRILGGSPPASEAVQDDLARAGVRATEPRELGHVEALRLLVRGDFTAAANRWHQINVDVGRDLAATRIAHDVYLHVGNVADRLNSIAVSVAMFENEPGWNLIASQYAFALEEAGHFDEAERVAWSALDADPMDLWATHALAHVYEHTGRHDASIELLRGRQETWCNQDSLAVHIWWHLALRLIDAGEYDEVLHIHDTLVPVANTPFRICDLTSMLWRLELAGVHVGDRWDYLAGALAERPERHTSGFLDLHSALVYSRRPDHPEAQRFFKGVAVAHADGASENDRIFSEVVRPLASAIANAEADPAASAGELEELDDRLHRIGGSNAQRDIVSLTSKYLTEQTETT